MTVRPDDIIAGIDLGGTRIKALALDPEGARLAEVNVPTRDGEAGEDGQPAFINGVKSALAELQAMTGDIKLVGLSAPGLVDRASASISFMPGRLQGLEGLNWAVALEREMVPVLNDAHSALLGEHWRGAARDCDNVFMLTLGTGVGGAILSDGHLLRGHLGRAGHLGHISILPNGPLGIVGLPGTLEETFSEVALSRKMEGQWPDVEALAMAAAAGDQKAAELWRPAVRELGRAIASLINVLDPQRIVLGGGIAHAGPALFEPLTAALDEFEWRPGDSKVELFPAELGALAGAYGAAKNALNQHFKI